MLSKDYSPSRTQNAPPTQVRAATHQYMLRFQELGVSGKAGIPLISGSVCKLWIQIVTLKSDPAGKCECPPVEYVPHGPPKLSIRLELIDENGDLQPSPVLQIVDHDNHRSRV